MKKLEGQVLMMLAFCAVTSAAMYLGWPWVVGFCLLFMVLTILG